MENKPFTCYQPSNISSICSFAYLWPRVLPPLDPQTQEDFLSPHSIGSETVAAPEFYYLFGNNRKERKKSQVGEEHADSGKGISGWRPHPTKTLTRPWETGLDSLSRQDIPVLRERFRELKAAPGGKGAGVKAALTARPEKKWRCPHPWTEATATHSLPNTHAYSTPPSCKVDTGSMHTR